MRRSADHLLLQEGDSLNDIQLDATMPGSGFAPSSTIASRRCSKFINVTNELVHAPVPAGDTIDLQWQGWPKSHHGAVITYLTFCGSDAGSCESINKTKLAFFAIDKVGIDDPNANATSSATAWGIWASDILFRNNATWVMRIAPTITPGYRCAVC
ncbi:endoglucanase-4 [Colletotrichum orchidophilum]|uniref:lytic cellulose monooxygenase (C4-dehydrogenating) n=1 Tax=Colletotrichum orchidophilum TaxID=1209926 RepID=A0A1G4BL87_9PEZI|nr:endoglucanase-4 [Colletotrichum orchidophilum]OHF02066.1 endoglucanase-4 [Colletotrichum orchidophilum]